MGAAIRPINHAIPNQDSVEHFNEEFDPHAVVEKAKAYVEAHGNKEEIEVLHSKVAGDDSVLIYHAK